MAVLYLTGRVGVKCQILRSGNGLYKFRNPLPIKHLTEEVHAA